MVNGLIIDDVVVSTDIEALQEKPKGNVVTRRFLDGTFQIQTVGEPTFTVAFTCYVNKEGMTEVLRAYNFGEEVFVHYNGSKYKGLIVIEPSFSYVVNEELNDNNKYFSSFIEIATPLGEG